MPLRPAAARGVLIPIVVSVCCFFIGAHIGKSRSPSRPSPITHTALRPTPQRSAPIPALSTRDEPLGLQWLKQGYRNAWQFSVLRSSVHDLNRTFTSFLHRDGALPRLAVCFTTLPNRLHKHVPRLLQILKQQTYKPDVIYASIPLRSRRSDQPFHIPDWLLNDPLVTVLRPPVDMGPATKLIPALEAEIALGNLETRVVSVDDDNEGGWREDSLLSLFAYSLHYRDAVIGLTGWNVTCMLEESRCSPQDSGLPPRAPNVAFNFIKQADDYACHSYADMYQTYYANCLGAVRKNFAAFVDVLEGYKGVVYQPRFFNMQQVKSLTDGATPDAFYACDDVWFSGWLAANRVPRLVVNPAIHENDAVRIALKNYSDARNLSIVHTDVAREDAVMAVEENLHSPGSNFVQSNVIGVRWFHDKSVWTADMWTRPGGFLYASEKEAAV